MQYAYIPVAVACTVYPQICCIVCAICGLYVVSSIKLFCSCDSFRFERYFCAPSGRLSSVVACSFAASTGNAAVCKWWWHALWAIVRWYFTVLPVMHSALCGMNCTFYLFTFLRYCSQCSTSAMLISIWWMGLGPLSTLWSYSEVSGPQIGIY